MSAPGSVWVSGGGLSGANDAIRALDDRTEAVIAAWRGNAAVDAAAKIVTGLGDHGVIWSAVTLVRVARRPERRRRDVVTLGVAGLTSLGVNAAVKRVVGRNRPDDAALELGDNIIPIRAPRSSSFPSGHTLAAFCAATAMVEPERPASAAGLLGFAALVGVSRLHVRAHHATDVLGGAAIGVGLGLLARRVVRALCD